MRFDRYRTLSCPFCGRNVEEPGSIELPLGGEATGGRCECGAVYVYDETGHQLGDAFNDALVLLYGGYDAAYSAREGEYEEETITYDRRTGRYVECSTSFGPSPKYLFLKKTRIPGGKDKRGPEII